MTFRVIRFKLTDDKYEVLITNLSNEEFTVDELKNIYAMRWGIETSFRNLKYSLSLMLFHSKKRSIFYKKYLQGLLCTILLN